MWGVAQPLTGQQIRALATQLAQLQVGGIVGREGAIESESLIPRKHLEYLFKILIIVIR
jgi:hypothetical protein